MRVFLVLIFLAAFQASALAQQWTKLVTVEEAVAHYPGRIVSLFDSLDLSHDGLDEVRRAVENKQWVRAGESLLSYYRNAPTARYLRRDQPVASARAHTMADSILGDVFKFYELADTVPRTQNGQLDWTHMGPDQDIEWAWGLNRHGHLQILLEAYFDTGNPKYAKAIDEHLQDWISASLPYPGVKSATAQWRGLEVALRAKVWVRVFFALVNSGHVSPATQILMLSSLPEHTHYMKNFHAQAGNWLTMEMSGLAMVATAWPEFRGSGGWVKYAKENMLEGLRDQVYPDGVQKELTSHYHQVALHNFDHFREICEEADEPLPAEYKSTLEKMHHYIASTVKPTGYGILNNDSDNRYNREQILQAAEDYDREDWLFIASNGKKGKRPAGPPSVLYPWAGQLIMRSGYDEQAHWGFFDLGPWGTGHQHNDKLHLSVAAFGRDLLVDGGRFAYRGALAEKFRAYARGSASHNVLLIDGAGQGNGPMTASHPVGENTFRITDQFDYASASFDSFRGIDGQTRHTRAVFYLRGKFWIVVDQVDTDRPRKIEALWHWHPDVAVDLEDRGIVSTRHDVGNLKIIPVGGTDWSVRHVKGQSQPEPQGWYSEKYNISQPSTVSVYSADIDQKSTFVWILQPSRAQQAAVHAEIVSRGEEEIRLKIRDEKSNEWEMVIPFSSGQNARYTFTSRLEPLIRPATGKGQADDIRQLLSRLDLGRKGLEAVNAAGDPEAAARELLSYYRKRSSVRHAVDRKAKETLKGKAADERDIAQANDAMRHVFVGQSAYPAYYCGDDVDWGSRPVPDNEWVWQLNRMGFWESMGKAYWHTGDEKYAREWALQLLDWTQKNPRDEAHAYAWRSIEAGIRGYRWTGLFQRFIDSPSFTPAVLVAFLNSCYDHAAYLMTKYRKGSNWGLMEAEGMAFIAMTFPEFAEADKWRTEGIRRLSAEIENQVYPDGHQRELAMGYHTGSIGWFKRTLDMATINGMADDFSPGYRQRIEKMCEIPFKLGLPDGATTQFGDSWKGDPGHIWPMLREWASLYDRDDFLYVASQGREGTRPDSTSFALPHSGFYSMRSSWEKDAVCLVLKCGPDGGGHCQPDNGTFELYAGGRHLMPDAGSYIYSSDPEGRGWFRQTKVHQTLTLDGKNSAYAPRQLLWKPGREDDILVVENGSYAGLAHRRAVFFVAKKYFVIVDEAIGNATGNVDLHFQLAPGGVVYDSVRLSARSDFNDGWNVMVRANAQPGIQMAREEGWVSFVYTKKERRPAFRYRMPKSSSAGVRFVTIVAPYDGKIPPDLSVAVKGDPAVGSNKLTLIVREGGRARKLGYTLRDSTKAKN